MAVNIKELQKKMIDMNIKSKKALSKASEINYITICNIFSLKNNPRVNTIKKLIITLNLSVEDAGKIFFAQELS